MTTKQKQASYMKEYQLGRAILKIITDLRWNKKIPMLRLKNIL